MAKFLMMNPEWVREPKRAAITEDRVEIMTEPGTDLWQRTYYALRQGGEGIIGESCYSFLCMEFA